MQSKNLQKQKTRYNKYKKRCDMKKISNYPLECLLIKKRMNKQQLQEETGLSSATIAKIKKDEDISLETLRIIADVLECNIQDLVTFEDVAEHGFKYIK